MQNCKKKKSCRNKTKNTCSYLLVVADAFTEGCFKKYTDSRTYSHLDNYKHSKHGLSKHSIKHPPSSKNTLITQYLQKQKLLE